MNRWTARSNDDPDLARWGLVALALVTGAFLMVVYVQLLHDSVARGAHRRYAQAMVAPAAAAEATRPAPGRLVSANP